MFQTYWKKYCIASVSIFKCIYFTIWSDTCRTKKKDENTDSSLNNKPDRAEEIEQPVGSKRKQHPDSKMELIWACQEANTVESFNTKMLVLKD